MILDNILDNVIIKIKEETKKRNYRIINRISNTLLNNIADVYEKYGYIMTVYFINDKLSRLAREKNDKNKEALCLILDVLNILEQFSIIQKNRHIGRYLIKNLKHVIS